MHYKLLQKKRLDYKRLLVWQRYLQKAAVNSVTLSMTVVIFKVECKKFHFPWEPKSFIFLENRFYQGDTTECPGDNTTVSLAPFSDKKCLSLSFRKLLWFYQQQLNASKATGAVVWDVKELQNTYLPLPTVIKGLRAGQEWDLSEGSGQRDLSQGLLLRHEGMEWRRLLWLSHRDTELRPLPDAPWGAALSPASELFLRDPWCSGLRGARDPSCGSQPQASLGVGIAGSQQLVLWEGTFQGARCSLVFINILVCSTYSTAALHQAK